MTDGDGPWFALVPKVELHVHLEGAIPAEALWTLITKYGGDPRVPTPAALDAVFQYRDFAHFIDTWIWKHSFLREPDDLTLIAEAAAREMARQRIVYAEAHYSPSDVWRTGMSIGVVTEAVRRGLDRVPDVEIALIADLVRDQGPDGSMRTLCEVAEVRSLGVIGVGLGGSEQSFPPGLFAAVFERARGIGFHATVHAGEAAGPESVRDAVDNLHAERIGHGTRAIEDPAVVELLAARHVAVEACPGSNVRTGVVASLEAHPIRRFLDAGAMVSVNTDDPAMFGLTLAGEFAALQDRLDFGDGEIAGLVLGAVESSWLPVDRKASLRRAIESDPAWPPERA